MMKFIALFLLIGSAQAQLQRPTAPGDYSAAFFLIDLTMLNAADRTNWVDPGDYWCMVQTLRRCDISQPTVAEARAALQAWVALSACEQWRVRLYHDSELRNAQNNGQKRYVVFTSSIPVSVRANVLSCLNTGEVAYIGDTYAIACAYLDSLITNYCDKFYPNKQFQEVVSGWEALFNVERPCRNFNRAQNQCVTRY